MGWLRSRCFGGFRILVHFTVVLCGAERKQSKGLRIAPDTYMPIMSLRLGNAASGKVISIRSQLDSWLKNGGIGIDLGDLSENQHQLHLAAALTSFGINRSFVFITAKVNACGDIQADVNRYLLNLHTNYIDLLLLYNYYLPNDRQCSQSWSILEEYYKQGVVQAIGVSNFDTGSIRQMLSNAQVAPMVNQLHYNLMHRDDDTRAFCDANHIALTSDAPVDSEGLSRIEVIRIAQRSERSPVEVVMQWIIQNGYSLSFSGEYESDVMLLCRRSDSWLLPEEMHSLDALSTRAPSADTLDNSTAKHSKTKKQKEESFKHEAHDFALHHVVFVFGFIALVAWGLVYSVRQRHRASNARVWQAACNDDSNLEFESFHTDTDS